MHLRAVSRLSSRVFSSLSSSSSSYLSSFCRQSSTATATASASTPSFNWKDLVGVHTSPATIEAFKEIDVVLNKYRTQVLSIPEAPPAIDWEEWHKRIQAKDLVQELFYFYHVFRLYYTAEEKFSDSAPSSTLTDFNTAIDATIAQAESIAAVTNAEAAKLQEHVKALEAAHAKIGGGIQSLPDFYAANPGIEQQLLREYENAEFVPTEAENRVAAIEPATIRAVLEKGGELNAGGEVPADRFGDYKPSEEFKKLAAWEQAVYGKIEGFTPTVKNFLPVETDPYADEHADEEGHH